MYFPEVLISSGEYSGSPLELNSFKELKNQFINLPASLWLHDKSQKDNI